MHKNIEATIVLGDLSLEDTYLQPKVLLVKLSGIYSNSRLSAYREKGMGQMIYSAPCPLAGRWGYKMRQLCGSSGATDSETNRKMPLKLKS